jgi:ribosomal protein L11 methyltransferase
VYPDAAVVARDVDDEDWARRSQRSLDAVTVGRLTIAPPWAMPVPAHRPRATDSLQPLTVVIQPSTGFGTGHHATTQLCLRALQTVDLNGKSVLDVGTGSGVLALAARALGADRASGIDRDPDAVRAAQENLPLNPHLTNVTFSAGNLTAGARPPADVVTANLTGSLLCRTKAALIGAVRTGGALIVSGLQAHERSEVVAAFAPAEIAWEAEADGWVGIVFRIAGLQEDKADGDAE